MQSNAVPHLDHVAILRVLEVGLPPGRNLLNGELHVPEAGSPNSHALNLAPTRPCWWRLVGTLGR